MVDSNNILQIDRIKSPVFHVHILSHQLIIQLNNFSIITAVDIYSISLNDWFVLLLDPGPVNRKLLHFFRLKSYLSDPTYISLLHQNYVSNIFPVFGLIPVDFFRIVAFLLDLSDGMTLITLKLVQQSPELHVVKYLSGHYLEYWCCQLEYCIWTVTSCVQA